jgi:Stress responsive A/B Barrel Domain
MISHIVLFRPRASLAPGERQDILHAVSTIVARCASVRSCRIGRRVRHGLAGYEQVMEVGFEYALVLDFDDLDGLRAYLTHPDHARLGDAFTSAADASLAYDYEILDLDAINRQD